jgi:hypothetical protein
MLPVTGVHSVGGHRRGSIEAEKGEAGSFKCPVPGAREHDRLVGQVDRQFLGDEEAAAGIVPGRRDRQPIAAQLADLRVGEGEAHVG